MDEGAIAIWLRHFDAETGVYTILGQPIDIGELIRAVEAAQLLAAQYIWASWNDWTPAPPPFRMVTPPDWHPRRF